jgi:hypothetical protein
VTSLILKRDPVGRNQEDYSVRDRNGVIVGRIFLSPVAPEHRPRMWASGHNGGIKRAAHGCEPTREAAMAAFAKSWRRVWRRALATAHTPFLTPRFVVCSGLAHPRGTRLSAFSRSSRF